MEVGQGPELLHQLARNRIEVLGVDLVVREHGGGNLAVRTRGAAERIIQRAGERRKIAIPPFLWGGGVQALVRPAALKSLEIRHEKQPVLAVEELGNPDRTTECEAVLIPAERRFGGIRTDKIVRFRIQIAVAEELVDGSV